MVCGRLTVSGVAHIHPPAGGVSTSSQSPVIGSIPNLAVVSLRSFGSESVKSAITTSALTSEGLGVKASLIKPILYAAAPHGGTVTATAVAACCKKAVEGIILPPWK